MMQAVLQQIAEERASCVTLTWSRVVHVKEIGTMKQGRLVQVLE